MKIRIDIQVEQWAIGRLIPRITNPRTHTPEQVALVKTSMKEFGWTNPILVDSAGGVLAGHARLRAAQELGMPEVPVIQLGHLTEAQQRALVIADNQLAITGAGWDEDTLRLELAALSGESFDMHLLGFDDADLTRLLAQVDATSGLTDEDAVPELPVTPVSAAGDLWNLDSHKLLVGDSTDESQVARLMAGDAADLLFIDSPYNVAYEGYTKDQLSMKNDSMSAADFTKFLQAAFRSCRAAAKPGASMYVCHSSSWQREFQNALETAGFEMRCQIIWAKNTFAWGFGRYKFQHEPLFYCHVTGQKDAWYGDKSQSTLWEENKPAANRIHPTAKPVELVERALRNSSKAGDLVVDLFGGSGSTLIACERQNRKSRLMEIDPRYADCIIQRFQEYSGKAATLDGDDRAFQEIAQERKKEPA
jgi:DNA modification methylase